MKRIPRMAFLLAALVLVLVLMVTADRLPGFVEQTDPSDTAGTTVPVMEYTVKFIYADQLVDLQTVREGAYPASVTDLMQGLTLLGWVGEDGASVRPETTAVTSDVTYTAVAYPALTGHVPFLFADVNGFLWPDAPLTEQAAVLALQTLAGEGAQAYFPELPQTDEVVTTGALQQLLGGFFPEENVQAAFYGEAADPVSRSAFAKGMLLLLGWDRNRPVTREEAAVLPLDVTAGREDAAALLEAAVPHSHSDQGTAWAQLSLPEDHAPGFHNFSGWLYYVREDGTFLYSDSVGDLWFGPDGRYSCGDEELDGIVAGILNELITANPELEGLDLLRKAFEYCRDSFKYLRKNAYDMGDTGWEIEDAKVMFNTGRGNCYNYAATFWALARGLGYEAWAISGTCTGTYQPHGWVLIELDGEDYFFDPEWEMAYRTERGIYDKDMFMIPMSKIWYWTYEWKRF